MTRIRLSIAMIFAVALVALAGFATPSAEAAASVHCESTGGGKFMCDTTIVGPHYYWSAGSNAVITQNLGQTAFGTCTIGTKPTVTVSAYYPLSNSVTYRPPIISASTSFSCSSVAL